jgi:hypothetical protein
MAHTVDPDREAAYPRNIARRSLPIDRHVHPAQTYQRRAVYSSRYCTRDWPSILHYRGLSTSASPVA